MKIDVALVVTTDQIAGIDKTLELSSENDSLNLLFEKEQLANVYSVLVTRTAKIALH